MIFFYTELAQKGIKDYDSPNNIQFWLEFWSKLISTLIWPAIFIFLFIFIYIKRDKFSKVLPNIFELLKHTQKLQLGSMAVSFTEELKDIEIFKNPENIENAEYTEDITTLFTPIKTFQELATIKPDLAILESWKAVEDKLRKDNTKLTSDNRLLNIGHMLRHNYNLNKNDRYSIDKLRILRNQVVHSIQTNLTYEDALEYRRKCMQAINILNDNKITN